MDTDFIPPSRTALLRSPPGRPRCFRTTPDGRIPLRRDWPALFAAASRFDETAFLTRHYAARLVHSARLPGLHWNGARTQAVSRDGAFALDFSGAKEISAWARLAVCACCGSPGRIELGHGADAEFLHLSAAPHCDLNIWSDHLAEFADAPPPDLPPSPDATCALPLAPRDTRLIAPDGEALAPLLAALGAEDAPLTCVLRTTETTHARTFVPQSVGLDDGVLTLTNRRTTLQLALPLVAALSASSHVDGWSLHALGATGRLLATFRAAPTPDAIAVWQAALVSAFPLLR